MTSAALEARVRRHEGLRLHPYRDTVGKLTIGVGRNLDDRGVTEAEALLMLRNDLLEVEARLDVDLPWWRDLDEVRREVLVEMGFNLGVDGLLAFHDTLAAVRRARYAEAGVHMLASRWAGQVGARAVELAALMRLGGEGGT